MEALLASIHQQNPDKLLQQAVRSNILASVDHLRQGSHILKELILNNNLIVAGAEYSVETGVVDFFDALPEVS